jgi:hypothetical protein
MFDKYVLNKPITNLDINLKETPLIYLLNQLPNNNYNYYNKNKYI